MISVLLCITGIQTHTQTTFNNLYTSLMTQYEHRQLRDLVLQPPDPDYKDELIVPVEQDIFRASVSFMQTCTMAIC